MLGAEVYRSDELGHVAVKVQITPDPLTQLHVFDFEFDQTYLAETIRGCHDVLEQYPIRNTE
jgi:hypothetical protein